MGRVSRRCTGGTERTRDEGPELQVGHHTGLLFHLQDGEHTTEPEPDGEAQRQVEDLVVGEVLAQALVELVVQTLVVDGEALGVFDRETKQVRFVSIPTAAKQLRRGRDRVVLRRVVELRTRVVAG